MGSVEGVTRRVMAMAMANDPATAGYMSPIRGAGHNVTRIDNAGACNFWQHLL